MDIVNSSTIPSVDRLTDRLASVSWPAILAGGAVALGSQIALSQLCVGLGLALWNVEGPASGIAFGTAIAWVLSGLVSLFFGGWVAGRLARRVSPGESMLHGAVAWSLTAVVGAVVAVTVAGALAGSTAMIVGKGIGVGVGAVTEVAKVVAPSWDTVKDDLSAAIGRVDSKSGEASGAAAPGGENRMADRARLMELMGKSFDVDSTTALQAPEKEELVVLLASQTGVSRDAAAKAYSQWEKQWLGMVEKYEAAKLSALEAAKAAKSYAAQAALWAFIAMLLGVVATVAGSYLGGRCALSPPEDVTIYESRVRMPPRASAMTS